MTFDDSTDIAKTADCRACKGARLVKLRRIIMASGADHIAWVCQECGHVVTDAKGRMYVPHAEVAKVVPDLGEIPVARDYSTGTRCVVCQQRGAEVHHWAPRAIFGDIADRWPTDMLCPECHAMWHQMTGVAVGGRAR